MQLFPKKKFFNKAQEEDIINAIREAEKNSSGEIRVHVESKSKKDDTFERALEVFQELEMHRTKQRNGVLFYLAMKEHKFSIVADEGINQMVPDGFWDDIKVAMESAFKEKKFTQGIAVGVKMTGEQLKEHFPYQDDDENELSDDISVGD